MVLHTIGLFPKLIFRLSDPGITVETVKIISEVITFLLKALITARDISRYVLRIHHQRPLSTNSFVLILSFLCGQTWALLGVHAPSC